MGESAGRCTASDKTEAWEATMRADCHRIAAGRPVEGRNLVVLGVQHTADIGADERGEAHSIDGYGTVGTIEAHSIADDEA